jgi:hypothetical protein
LIVAISIALCCGLFFWIRSLAPPPQLRLKDAALYSRDTLAIDASWSEALESIETPSSTFRPSKGQVLVLGTTPAQEGECAGISVIPSMVADAGSRDIVVSPVAAVEAAGRPCTLSFVILSRPATASGSDPGKLLAGPLPMTSDQSFVLRTRTTQALTLLEATVLSRISGHVAVDGELFQGERHVFEGERVQFAASNLKLHRLVLEPGDHAASLRASLLSASLSEAVVGDSNLRVFQALRLGFDAWRAIVIWIVATFASALAAWVWQR